MERSDDISATIIRIMKSMDRSNAILLKSIGCFEDTHSFVDATLIAPQPVGSIRVGESRMPILKAVVQ